MIEKSCESIIHSWSQRFQECEKENGVTEKVKSLAVAYGSEGMESEENDGENGMIIIPMTFSSLIQESLCNAAS